MEVKNTKRLEKVIHAEDRLREVKNKTKRQPTEWEKIFANDATNKRLVSKIYKQLMMRLNTIKTKNASKNRQKS